MKRVGEWLLEFMLVRLLIVLLFTIIMLPLIVLSALGSMLICIGAWTRAGCDTLIDLMWGTA
jgi:hypothetical protein